MNELLSELERVLEQRKSAEASESYVASLHARGLNKILEKVGREALVGEAADLWFHLMVALSHLEVPLAEVVDCLAGRFGISGLEEKAARGSAAE